MDVWIIRAFIEMQSNSSEHITIGKFLEEKVFGDFGLFPVFVCYWYLCLVPAYLQILWLYLPSQLLVSLSYKSLVSVKNRVLKYCLVFPHPRHSLPSLHVQSLWPGFSG